MLFPEIYPVSLILGEHHLFLSEPLPTVIDAELERKVRVSEAFTFLYISQSSQARLFPRDPNILFMRGMVLEQENNVDQAFVSYAKAALFSSVSNWQASWRIGSLERKLHAQAPLFHLVWSTDASSFEPWRGIVLDQILHHHANCNIHIYSNTINGHPLLSRKLNSNQSISIVPIDDFLFVNTPIYDWWRLQKAVSVKGPFFYSHLSDAIRLVVLLKQGGTYMDFDVFLVKPVTFFNNAFGYEDGHFVNIAISMFQAQHQFIRFLLDKFAAAYDPIVWNCVGPGLITDALGAWTLLRPHQVFYHEEAPTEHLPSSDLQIHTFHKDVFYPVHWRNSAEALFTTTGFDASAFVTILKKSVALHIWTKVTFGKAIQHGSMFATLAEAGIIKDHGASNVTTIRELSSAASLIRTAFQIFEGIAAKR